MKKLLAIIMTVLVLLSLSSCGETEELESRLMETEAALSQAEEAIAEADETVAELESTIAEIQKVKLALKSENDVLESEVEMLTLQLEEINQSYMLKYHIHTEDPEIRACIVSDTVFYSDPWPEAEQGFNVENSYATVILQATVTNMHMGQQSFWYLIKFEPISSPCNNIGWVPADSVVEYCAENKTDIIWPVTLRDGAVVYKDDKCSIVLDDDISWAKHFTIRNTVDGIVNLGLSGYGSTLYVRIEDVVYPTV